MKIGAVLATSKINMPVNTYSFAMTDQTLITLSFRFIAVVNFRIIVTTKTQSMAMSTLYIEPDKISSFV